MSICGLSIAGSPLGVGQLYTRYRTIERGRSIRKLHELCDGGQHSASKRTRSGGTSAPMGGPDDPHAVVDVGGRVRGVDGLRVVDASIFPTTVSVPTNLAVIMAAERIAAQRRHCGDDGH